MKHSTPSEAHYNLVSAFPVNALDETKFIVIIAKSLGPLTEKYSGEMNINAVVFDQNQAPLDAEAAYISELRSFFSADTGSLFGTLYDSGLSLVRIPLENGEDASLWLALTSDVAEFLREQENYTYSMIGLTFLTVVIIFLFVFILFCSLLFLLLLLLFSIFHALLFLGHTQPREIQVRRRRRFLSTRDPTTDVIFVTNSFRS